MATGRFHLNMVRVQILRPAEGACVRACMRGRGQCQAGKIIIIKIWTSRRPQAI